MSVAPDFLLQSAPEVRPKAPPAKAQSSAPEPAKREASSFAEVYAKERQAKPGERAGSADKSSQEQSSAPTAGEPDTASTAAEQSAVAASGNSLPTQEGTEEELDPLLAMALGGIQAQVAEAPVVEESSDVPALVIAGATTSATEQAEPVLEDDALDPLALLKQPAEEAGKAQAPQDAAIKSTKVATSTGFAAAMAAMGKGEETLESSEESTLDLPLENLAKDALESLKDSVQPNRPDQFVSKLSALTQALNHQAGAAQRLPLVPGQPVAMQQGGWSEAVVDRVMWLSSQNLKSAEIQLDPADLGRLEVRVNVAQEQTQVTFASPNAGVREALEGQLHRLRELFSQQGMNLLDVNVSDQSLHRGWQGQEGDGRGRGGGAEPALGAGEEEVVGGLFEQQSRPGGRGLVDYYA